MSPFRAISNLLRFDRTNWKVLALCFIAAGIFWIFNALNKSYATNVRLPLKFEFDGNLYAAVEPLPSQLLLNVSGNGWEIIRKGLGVKVPDIIIPLERPAEIHKMVASSLTPLVASQLSGLKLNYIVTDTLMIRIDHTMSRAIRLRPSLEKISFKKNFGRVSPVSLVPDSVILTGPMSILQAMPDTLVVDVPSSRLGANYRESIEIRVPHNESISRNPPVTEIMFEVAEVGEFPGSIKITIPRLPWGVEVKSDSVHCLFRIPLKDWAQFQAIIANLSASIQIPELRKGESRHIVPSLPMLPLQAELIHLDSILIKRY